MVKTKKVLLFPGIALLAAVVLLACSLPFSQNNGEENGWYIKINITDPSEAKAVVVSEYEVTALNIEVFDPEEQLLETFQWNAAEGPASYVVPVTQEGPHRIDVTHIGEDNGEPVEATESTTANIRAMVITVVNITPGCIGIVDVEPGEEPEPIDLTGYWDLSWMPEVGPAIEPILFYIEQTGSTLNCSQGFTGSIEDSSVILDAWLEMEEEYGYILLEGTVSDGEISGTVTGDFGDGTFRMVESTMPFGRLDLEGTVDGVPVSVHTDYALGHGGETETSYIHTFSIDMGSFIGYLWLRSDKASVGTYFVSENDPQEPDQIEVSLWDGYSDHMATGGEVVIDQYDAAGMVGSFDLSFSGGSSISGTFDLNFGMASGTTSVEGTWQGSAIPYTARSSVHSDREVANTGEFELAFEDHESVLFVWLHVDGTLDVGVYQSPADHWWIGLDWRPPSGPGLDEINIDDPGTLTITRFAENDGIAGSFEALDGALICGFDVSFVETPF
jgi:hypothetical protein